MIWRDMKNRDVIRRLQITHRHVTGYHVTHPHVTMHHVTHFGHVAQIVDRAHSRRARCLLG